MSDKATDRNVFYYDYSERKWLWNDVDYVFDNFVFDGKAYPVGETLINDLNGMGKLVFPSPNDYTAAVYVDDTKITIVREIIRKDRAAEAYYVTLPVAVLGDTIREIT